MKNLKINKSNVKKIFIGLGIGGIIVLVAKNGFIKNNDVQQYIPNTVQKVILSDDEYTSYENKLNLSNEEFLKRFDEIYYNSDNLQENWSDIYPEIREFVSLYGKDLKQDKILESLPKLKIITDSKIPGNDSLAMYDNKKNVIKLSSSLKYKKISEMKKTKLHESFHFLFQDGFYESSKKYNKKGIMLDEGLVSLLNQEFECNDNGDNYMKASNYVRILCEILGKEEFMYASGAGGMDYLVEKLSQYSSEEDAIKLIDNIDKASVDYNHKNTEYDKKAWKIIYNIYQNKHGKSVEDSNDEIMKLYCNQTLGTYYDILGNEYSIRITANKNYFINQNKNSILIENDSSVDEIQLDNNSSSFRNR